MHHAEGHMAGTALAGSLAPSGRPSPSSPDVPAIDPDLERRLAAMDVGDLVQHVDAGKTADGEAGSIALYRAWLALSVNKPGQLFAAWYNLGVQLNAAGAVAEAAAAFEQALSVRADLFQAAINAGLCHERLGDPARSLRIWDGALQADTARTALLNQRARLLETLGRYEEAEAALVASLLTVPDQDDVIHHWIGIRAKTCAWPVVQPLPGLSEARLREGTCAITALAVDDDVATHRQANARWIEARYPGGKPRLSPAGGYAHPRIRVGYLSTDFCSHPIAFLLADLLEQHSRDRFEVYGYCASPQDGSDARRRVLAAFDHVRIVGGLGDRQTAEAIRHDEIDILVELNGLTLGTRIEALRWRPAPVQLSFLGYNGAMPFAELDYLLADRFVIPPATAATHEPKPLYLPACYQPNDRHLPVAGRQTRAAAGLPEDRFVFCCFSNTYKITEAVFGAWMQIVRRTPGAVLWLYADNGAARRNLQQRWARGGLEDARLIFAERIDPASYRGRLALADLFLDTFPYNAGTTASDALRVGLPLVTLTGRSFASRMAGSLLERMGRSECIATTLDAYVELAVALAGDPDRYRALRALFAGDAFAETLGDTPGFVRDYEAVLASVVVRPSQEQPSRSAPGVKPPRRARAPRLRAASV